VKTTVEIPDALLDQARKYARKTGRPVRALVEEGLRLALQTETHRAPYKLPDRSTGKPGGKNPLELLSWQDLRSEIYGGR